MARIAPKKHESRRDLIENNALISGLMELLLFTLKLPAAHDDSEASTK
jgi:hypothetical protein